MEKAETTAPKVFVSYSWSSQEHQDWILEWATRLRADGVDVILDLWELKKGHDKYAFMERMVTDPSVVKVIIVSDSEYAIKADARKGGVGTESQIISREIYEQVNQEKFIPVACQSDGIEPFLPTFLKGRIYIDFSTPDKANENYEQLLRAIFDKPLHQKPSLGQAPQYLFEESKALPSSRPLLVAFKTALLNDRGSYNGLATHFLEDFFNKFEAFRAVPTSEVPLDELVVKSIDDFIPYRNEFLEFASLVFSMRDDQKLYEQIAEFFERLLSLQYPATGTTPWVNATFDNFRFISYELFLYVIALLIRYKHFAHVSLFLEKHYVLPENARSLIPRTNFTSFAAFNPDCESFGERNHRLKLNRMSLQADFIKNRATLKEISFQQLIQADCVCFLKTLILHVDSYPWDPHTVIYLGHGQSLELFIRAQSRNEFRKLLSLLNVNSKDELVTRYNEGAVKYKVSQWGMFRHISFPHIFNLENLDTI